MINGTNPLPSLFKCSFGTNFDVTRKLSLFAKQSDYFEEFRWIKKSDSLLLSVHKKAQEQVIQIKLKRTDSDIAGLKVPLGNLNSVNLTA